MGEIADGLINGDFDAETGEWLGEGDGFPRVTRNGKTVPQHDAYLPQSYVKQQAKENKRRARAHMRGFLHSHHVVKRSVKLEILREYYHPKFQDRSLDSLLVLAEEDFKKFKEWFLKNHK